MSAEGAFRSRGGPELFIEISLNKGRPVDLTEVIDALQRFNWTASIAEALTNYGAWIVRGQPSDDTRFSEFDSWLKSPDPFQLSPPIEQNIGGLDFVIAEELPAEFDVYFAHCHTTV
jgi:hypothetical protein